MNTPPRIRWIRVLVLVALVSLCVWAWLALFSIAARAF